MKGIALVGPAGVGKTSVGKVVSHMLGYPFIDLDQEIVHDTGLTIAEIFATGGETQFRKSEYNSLVRVTHWTADTPCILATGGGLVVSPECRHLLREQWTVVFLQGSVDTLLTHLDVEGSRTRPLLSGEENVAIKVSQMWEQRRSLYEQVAAYTIHVDHRTPEDIAKEIIAYVDNLL